MAGVDGEVSPSSSSTSSSLEILLFGDQSGAFLPALQQLLLKRQRPALQSFIEQVHLTLRTEIALLPFASRQQFPAFSSLHELTVKVQKGASCPAIDSVLSTTYQLCCILNACDVGGSFYLANESRHLLGLCIGSLAASAVSVSRSPRELLAASIDAVRVALQIGLRVTQAAALIASDDDSTAHRPWSYVVPYSAFTTCTIEHALSEFKSRRVCSEESMPYISARAHNNFTLSGPPTIIDRFLTSALPSGAKAVGVAIYAPYHAPHIYTEDDVQDVMRSALAGSVSALSAVCPVISSSSGTPYQAATYDKILECAVRDILLLPLDFTKAAESISSIDLPGGSASRISLLPVATSHAASFVNSVHLARPHSCVVDDSIMVASRAASEDFVASGRPSDSKIAIVGMSGRFPDAADLEAFWDLLYQGLDVHRKVPEDRFDADLYHDPTGSRKNTTKSINGCWIREPGLFDPKFFNISPKEAAQSDPGQRLALQTAYEAMEMAGMVPDRTPSTKRDRVGVFYGMTSDDWREVNSGQNIDTYFIPGGNRAFTPGRLNYFFKFTGPSLSIDTACSSSLAAIHSACNALWKNDCDTAIAGGTNVMTNPDNFAGLDRGHFLSPTGNCNTFDDAADGYCRADGVGTIILKRLEDAQADKDPVLGVIIGAHTNHSAESVSITRPHAGAQEYIFSKLLHEGGVHPHEISYIEMHGTGTQAGDATEMSSVLNTFAPGRDRLPHESLHLGSAKANVGHAESASGVVSLIKVLLMMKHSMIPPHCGIKGTINHKFPTDLDQRNVHIAMRPQEWKRPAGARGLRRVFVDNFSAAGGNSALLVEDSPLSPSAVGAHQKHDVRSTHMVAVSARTPSSLRENISRLKSYVESGSHADGFLPKLAYTTTARRIHHPFRLALCAQSVEGLVGRLSQASQIDSFTRVRADPPAIGFAFTGQGAQYTAMGRQFFESIASFRADMTAYNKVARNHGFPSILPLIDGTSEVNDLSPLVVQLGTMCFQMALANLWRSLGVRATFAIGHSLGLFAALYVSGVLSASDAVFLVGTRARLLEEQCEPDTHAMLAIRASLPEVTPHLVDSLHEIACVNGPKEVVISGRKSHIEQLSESLAARGTKTTRINVPFAFHSSQVDAILPDLEKAAAGCHFNPPKIHVASALLSKMIAPGDVDTFGPRYIARHCRESVLFADALNDAAHAGLLNAPTIWIEIGPHPVCSSFLKSTLGAETVALPTLKRGDDAFKTMTETMSELYSSGLDLNWDEFHKDFEACQTVLPLPSYSWENKNYWIKYVHDWTLTKGDPPSSSTPAAVEEAPPQEKVTASVQRIVKDTIDSDIATIIAETDFGSEQLREIARGHSVNNTNLCTSSLYADIGLTLGKRLLDKYHAELTSHAVDVHGMAVDKPLILNDSGPTLFRAEVSHDVRTLVATMSIYSVNAAGAKTMQHANCQLRLEDSTEWTQDWERHQHFVQRSIGWLRSRADQGFDTQLSTGMIYKLFSSLVDYSDVFKGLQQAIVHSTELEATAKVSFRCEKGDFFCNPIWIDSCGQLTGFLMNGHESTGPQQVFINHGWVSLRLAEEFRKDVVYKTYIRMRNIEGTKYRGDLYILDGQRIIGVYQGITFLGIARRALDMALPPSKSGGRNDAAAVGNRHVGQDEHRSARPPPLPPQHKGRASMPQLTEAAVPSVSVSNSLRIILKILSDEIGVPLDALDDAFSFSDYGVDSLLALNVSGRLREELSIDIDSAVLLSCPTLGEFTSLLDLADTPDTSSTPSSSTDSTKSLSESSASEASTSVQDASDGEGETQLERIYDILADEIGVSSDEIKRCSSWATLGLDSLLSLTILGRLREELGVDLEADFFQVNDSVRSLQERFQPVSVSRPTATSKQVTERLSDFRASSTLLQGSPKTAKYTLFLCPDGSGSSTSYAAIERVGPDVCVYGLFCPWLKSSDKLVTFGIKGLSTLYVQEMQRRQPKGPYNIGGWSAGGICAYEAAVQLTSANHKVDRLVMLDAPNPIGLEKLPKRLFDFFDSRGVFGEDNGSGSSPKAPDWLLSHFLDFIEALDRYKIQPWSSSSGSSNQPRPPRTHILWAEDGVCKNPSDERPEYLDSDPREMRWLIENRTDFGPNGWDIVVGKANISIERLKNANHFNMMRKGPSSRNIAEFLGRVFH